MAFDPKAFLNEESAPTSISPSRFDPKAFLAGETAPIQNKIAPIDESAAFSKQYIREARQNPITKLWSQGAGLVGGALGMAKEAVSQGIKGESELLGNAMGDAMAGDLSTAARLPATLKQTFLEGAGRAGFDVVNLARSISSNVMDRARELPGDIAAGRIGAVLRKTHPLGSLVPYTPGTSEIENALARKKATEQEAIVRERGVAPEIFGEKAQPELANLTAAAIQAAIPGPKGVAAIPPIIKGIRSAPLIEGSANLARAGLDIAGGTAKAIGRSLVPRTAENAFIEALSPTMQGTARESAKRSVSRVIAQAPQVAQESGLKFDTAKGTFGAADFKLKDIWSQVEQKAGQSITRDLTPVADVYKKLAENPVINTVFPEIGPKLLKEAEKYDGKVFPVRQIEEINQTLNAINESLELMSQADKSVAMRANPLLRGGQEAVKKVRSILEEAIGPEYGELKNDYGAWKNIKELANKQSIRQDVLDGRISLYEGLGFLGSVGASGFTQGLTSALTGKVLKYIGTPDAKFRAASRIISQNVPKVPARVPPVLPPGISAEEARNLAMAQSATRSPLQTVTGQGPTLEQGLQNFPRRTLSQEEIRQQMAQASSQTPTPLLPNTGPFVGATPNLGRSISGEGSALEQAIARSRAEAQAALSEQAPIAERLKGEQILSQTQAELPQIIQGKQLEQAVENLRLRGIQREASKKKVNNPIESELKLKNAVEKQKISSLQSSLTASKPEVRQAVVNDWLAANPKAAAQIQGQVDEVAKAGNYKKAYHGSPESNITSFDPETFGERTGAKSATKGFFFTSSKEVANSYDLRQQYNVSHLTDEEIPSLIKNLKEDLSVLEKLPEKNLQDYAQEYVSQKTEEEAGLGNMLVEDSITLIKSRLDQLNKTNYGKTYEVYLKYKNPYEIDALGKQANQINLSSQVDDAIAAGNDAVIVKNVRDAMHFGVDKSTVTIVFDPSQIKSSDPITFNHQGNIIPLSQRFKH